MKIGIFITARLTSSRLPGKHLLPMSGFTGMEILAKRISHEFAKEISSNEAVVVITTTDEEASKKFLPLKIDGLNVFFGSKNNIPLRHLQALQKFDLDAFISVDGDDVLCSVDGMRIVYSELKRGSEWVATDELPFGMNSSGMRKELLQKAMAGNDGKSLQTGWGRIFEALGKQPIKIKLPLSNHEDLRFTLDYPEDLVFFSEVAAHFAGKIFTTKDEDIIQWALKSGAYKKNTHLKEKYWENYYKEKQLEIAAENK